MPSPSRDLEDGQEPSERTPKARVVRLGGREIIVAEGQHLSFWADISHRCMTASWPSFIAGAALVFVAFNAIFAVLYWIADQPISNVPGGAYIDYLYFSIETLSTAGYGDMHPQTHYGHFVAAVELFTGIFSMSLMTGLIFARFSRPNARLLFADHPVISSHEGKPTLMVRLVNERHNIIGNATAKLWLMRNEVSLEGGSFRRFYELPLVRNEHPALALSWTLYHVIDEQSPLYGLNARRRRCIRRFAGGRGVRIRCCCGANHPRAKILRPSRHSLWPPLRRYPRHLGGRPASDRLRQVP